MKEKMPEDRSPALPPLTDEARPGFSRVCCGDRGDGAYVVDLDAGRSRAEVWLRFRKGRRIDGVLLSMTDVLLNEDMLVHHPFLWWIPPCLLTGGFSLSRFSVTSTIERLSRRSGV